MISAKQGKSAISARATPARAGPNREASVSLENRVWHELATRVAGAPEALRRKRGSDCSGSCGHDQQSAGGALKIGQPGDHYEQEADRVAEQVMRMPATQPISGLAGFHYRSAAPSVQAKCAQCDEEEKALQRTEAGPGPSAAPASVHHVLRSPSQTLDARARSFMESRFGQDLGHVRIHTDGQAAESAKAVNALAYTVGRDIVFGAAQYRPDTSAGLQLLAHELTHVAQQESGRSLGVVQRAEVDDRSCAGLTDIETDIDSKVNSEIAAARTTVGTPIPVPALLKEVMTQLGKGAVSPIEDFIEAMPATKRKLPPSSLAGTKYFGAGTVNQFYKLQTLGLAHVVGSAANIHSICVGADKLGHFFEEGYLYFQVTKLPGKTATDAQSAGRALEIGIQGLASTGVYSNADQSANLAGMQFYKDLEANPAGLTFKIANYITDKWNEQSNPSFYESSIAGVVWGNLLTGVWQGPFTSAGGTSTPIDSKVTLSASATSVAGTYDWPAVKPTNHGKITGAITQKTTAVSGEIPGRSPVSDTPVSGISIAFDWSEGAAKGKGVWNSTDEQTLDGTWGIGTSTTDGGSWKLKKT